MSRWAHLTYTSVDSADAISTGGWQVKQESPMSTSEREDILTAIPTRLPLVEPLPAYPSETELAAAPRRLALVSRADGSNLLIHTASAGTDAAGRPGNVFSHALLDRDPLAPLDYSGPVRPIELWRSPSWLTPYGAVDVRNAWFDHHVPVRPGTAVTRRTVIDFLYEDLASRQHTLLQLLDAVVAALGDGPRVAIVTTSADEGALWIGLVSFLAAPALSAKLSFSTYERADDALETPIRTVLSVVPHKADRNDICFVDPLDREPVGSFQPASQWARLVDHGCRAGALTLDDRLLAMDAIGTQHPDAADQCPWWPLAVSMAAHPLLADAYTDVAPIVLRETPVYPPLDPMVLDAIDGLVHTAARRSTAAVWDLLAGQEQRPSVNPDLLAALRRGYLNQALSDVDWLTDRRPPPVPETSGDEVYEVVAPALDRLRARHWSRPDWPDIAGGAIEMLYRYGVDPPTRHLLESLRADAIGTMGVYR